MAEEKGEARRPGEAPRALTRDGRMLTTRCGGRWRGGAEGEHRLCLRVDESLCIENPQGACTPPTSVPAGASWRCWRTDQPHRVPSLLRCPRCLPAACLTFLRTRTRAALGGYQRVHTSGTQQQQEQAVAMAAMAPAQQRAAASPGQDGTFAGGLLFGFLLVQHLNSAAAL